MTATTANRGYTYPQSTDDVRPYEDFQQLAEDVDADVATLVSREDSPLPQGVIKRGRRITSSGNITTSETGILRVDSIPVYAGRLYKISTSNMNIDTSADNDVARVSARISTSGSATTTSTIIGFFRNTIDNASQSNVHSLTCFYAPGSDATLSVLLSVIRQAGTGNIILFGDATDICDLVIEDMGIDPGDSGVVI